MKKQFSALGVFVLALGALATQSCESTGGQYSYYNRGQNGYYRDGQCVQNSGYYQNGRYAQVNGVYVPNNGYYPTGNPQ
jgi:hypothetical protein